MRVDLHSPGAAFERQARIETLLTGQIESLTAVFMKMAKNVALTWGNQFAPGPVGRLWADTVKAGIRKGDSMVQGDVDYAVQALLESDLPDAVYLALRAAISAWVSSPYAGDARVLAEVLDLTVAEDVPDYGATFANRSRPRPVPSAAALETFAGLKDAGVYWREKTALIAQTTATGLAGNTTWRALLAMGVPEKKWIARHDDKTRTTHSLADGQVVQTAAFFAVGGAGLSYPGDRLGPIEEWANCRCVMVGVGAAVRPLTR